MHNFDNKFNKQIVSLAQKICTSAAGKLNVVNDRDLIEHFNNILIFHIFF